MATIEYPGADLRPAPAFTCSLPDGWVAAEAPGALFVAHTGVADERGGPSLRVETIRVPAQSTLRDVAAASLARSRRAHPDLAVVTHKVGRFGAQVAHLCGAVWGEADGRRAQLQVVLFAAPIDGRAVWDALIVTGGCAESDASALVPEFVRVAASVRFAEPTTTEPGEPAQREPVDAADPFTSAGS